jgi:hypothetical protein
MIANYSGKRPSIHQPYTNICLHVCCRRAGVAAWGPSGLPSAPAECRVGRPRQRSEHPAERRLRTRTRISKYPSKSTQISQILQIQDKTHKNQIQNPKIHVQMKGREGGSKGITGEKHEGEGCRVAVAVRHAAVASRCPTVASRRPAVASARVRAVAARVRAVASGLRTVSFWR